MNNETKYLIDTLTKNLVMKVMEDFGYSIPEAMDAVAIPSSTRKFLISRLVCIIKAQVIIMSIYAENY